MDLEVFEEIKRRKWMTKNRVSLWEGGCMGCTLLTVMAWYGMVHDTCRHYRPCLLSNAICLRRDRGPVGT